MGKLVLGEVVGVVAVVVAIVLVEVVTIILVVFYLLDLKYCSSKKKEYKKYLFGAYVFVTLNSNVLHDPNPTLDKCILVIIDDEIT